jgi:predicted Zn finger-like uncharacterized protein
MSIQRIVGYLASAVLFFFGVIFALASVYENTRLVVSIVMFMVAFGILFFLYRHQPQELVQRLEVPGKFQTQEIRCPNCSASIDIDNIKIVKGTPLVKCLYCGHVFEIIEEPKW